MTGNALTQIISDMLHLIWVLHYGNNALGMRKYQDISSLGFAVTSRTKASLYRLVPQICFLKPFRYH